MRFTSTFILALAGSVSSTRLLDPKGCDGKGACMFNSQCQYKFIDQGSVTTETAYACGDAGILTLQEAAIVNLAFRGGLSDLEVVPKADFPTCDIIQPGPDSVLLPHVNTPIIANEKTLGRVVNGLPHPPYNYSTRVVAYTHWDGRESDSPFHDDIKGFARSVGPSFNLYKQKRFMKKKEQKWSNDEDCVNFDMESDPKYENINPGTMTVEGFGMECWEYEEIYGRKRDRSIFMSCAKLPGIEAKKLLRRVDELRRDSTKFGWNPAREKADLEEFFGNMGYTSFTSRPKGLELYMFYNTMNRTDIFVDFCGGSSIGLECNLISESGAPGIWNFLWQIILAKEAARRMQMPNDSSSTGFTDRVLASLIVQDLWFQNVEVILTNQKIPIDEIKGAATPEDAVKAEEFKEKGSTAMKQRKYKDAVDLYTEAMKLDLKNTVYRCYRAAASLVLEGWLEALEDSYIYTQLNPKYAKAWSRFGTARLKRGLYKRAKSAFQRAIQVSGKDVTDIMTLGLQDAEKKMKEEWQTVEKEKDDNKRDDMRKAILEKDWDIMGKGVEFHSHVHEQQVEGLLLFAERIRWPYINEVRDFAEGVYGDLRAGQTIPVDLWDWLFGMTLPGKWMSFKIMSALILSTPSIRESCGTAFYFECGLALQRKSYWRLRTVLGRVLGCLPRVTSLCGWIGLCPPVEFDPPLSEEEKGIPRHVRLKARSIAPLDYSTGQDDNVIHVGPRHDRYKSTRLREDEDLPTYIAEMKDEGKWFIPEPPIRDLTTITIKSIRLKRLPLEINVAAQASNKSISEKEINDRTQYRASIDFAFDSNEATVRYTLYTNPIFVTPPACYQGPSGLHEVHIRELPFYRQDIWTVDQLKNHTPEDMDGGVMVINATGNGAEVLARAWCSERSKNAVIRRAGGPCYVCAVRAASKSGLGVGILIWVS